MRKLPNTPGMVSDVGHLDSEADPAGLDEIVDHADEQAPNNHETTPDMPIRREHQRCAQQYRSRERFHDRQAYLCVTRWRIPEPALDLIASDDLHEGLAALCSL